MPRTYCIPATSLASARTRLTQVHDAWPVREVERARGLGRITGAPEAGHVVEYEDGTVCVVVRAWVLQELTDSFGDAEPLPNKTPVGPSE